MFYKPISLRSRNIILPIRKSKAKLIKMIVAFRTNTLFASIPLLNRDLEKEKSGKPINLDRFSARVTPTGF